MNNQITEAYLKENHACEESYAWLRKQKNKDWRVLSQKLYEEKNYKWCLWMLCRKTSMARVYIWLFIVLCFVLEIGLLIVAVAVGLIVVALASGVAVVFAAGVFAVDVMGLTFASGVAVVFAAGVFAVVVAIVAGAMGFTFVAGVMGVAIVAVAFTAVASNSIQKLICFLCLKKINRC